MSFSKSRKRSGLILTGVALSSSILSAANHGFVDAVPQSEINNTLKNLAGKGVKNSNGTVVNFFKSNWGWILLAVGVLAVICFSYYKGSFNGEIGTESESLNKDVIAKPEGKSYKNDKIKIIYKKSGHKNKNREEDEYGMVSLFCKEESGPFSEIINKPLVLLANYYYEDYLGIEGTKIEVTVEELLKILKTDSKEKLKKAVGNDSKKKVEIKLEEVSEDGSLSFFVEDLELDLETKYVSPDNVDGLIGFVNKVFEKASDDSKKDYRFELKKEDGGNVSIKLIENKINGKQVESSFVIELGEDKENGLYVKNEKNLNSLILKYQYGNEEVNIFDKLFFESTDGETSYKNNCFNFSKDLEFIGRLELEVSSNTLCRILNDESYGSLPDEALDYLDENENVKISFLPRDRYSLKFMLYNKNVGDFFDCALETRCADNNVDKFIKFYNYILEEAYKQKKIDFKVSLEKKESKKIVVKHGSREYEFNGNKNLKDILSEIENDTKNIFAKGVKNIAALSLGAGKGIGKLSENSKEVILGEGKNNIAINEIDASDF